MPRLKARLGARIAVVAGCAAAGAIAAGQAAPWVAAGVGVYLVAAVALVWIDLDVHRIPDRILGPTAAGLVVTLLWGGIVEGPQVWLQAAVGAAAFGLPFLLLALFGPMGRGDVKLAVVTGLLVGPMGWSAGVTAIAGTFLLGGLVGAGMLLRGRRRDDHLAYGPMIIAGAALAAVTSGVV
ncbi:prepilin peptidase [Promicromonospora sp. Marseille-Q5078]